MGISVSAASESTLPELLAAAQSEESDDTVAMNEILRRFDPLAWKIAYAMTSNWSDQWDIANAARWGLVRAVRGHDLMRPGFPAYARQHMRGAAARELIKIRETMVVPTAPGTLEAEELSLAPLTQSDLGRPWGSGRTARAVGTLSESQRILLRQRYVDETLLKDIAASSGTSVPAVSQRLATAHRKVGEALASA